MIFFHYTTAPSGPWPPHYRGFTITLRRQPTFGRTPLDEWSTRRRNLYLTTNNTHKTGIYAPAGFEPPIPTSERPQTQALERAVTGICSLGWLVSGISKEHGGALFTFGMSNVQLGIWSLNMGLPRCLKTLNTITQWHDQISQKKRRLQRTCFP
jgi:hypothetical protein